MKVATKDNSNLIEMDKKDFIEKVNHLSVKEACSLINKSNILFRYEMAALYALSVLRNSKGSLDVRIAALVLRKLTRFGCKFSIQNALKEFKAIVDNCKKGLMSL